MSNEGPVEYVQIKRARDLHWVNFAFAEPQLADEVLVVHLEPCAICGCEVCAGELPE